MRADRRSTRDGTMHACGHDGHAAMLSGGGASSFHASGASTARFTSSSGRPGDDRGRSLRSLSLRGSLRQARRTGSRGRASCLCARDRSSQARDIFEVTTSSSPCGDARPRRRPEPVPGTLKRSHRRVPWTLRASPPCCRNDRLLQPHRQRAQRGWLPPPQSALRRQRRHPAPGRGLVGAHRGIGAAPVPIMPAAAAGP